MVDFTKIFSDAMQVFSKVKTVTDSALDNVITQSIHKAEEKLAAFNKEWRVNFLRTLCLDTACIAVTLICIGISLPWNQAFPIICAAGAAKLIWTLWRTFRLFKNLKPHKELILRFAPETFNDLWQTRSFSETLKSAIRKVFRFYYGEKLSSSVKTIHSIAAFLGAVSSADDVENKITDAVYPPLGRYVRRVLLVNVLCFTIFYGLFISLVKIFFLNQIGN
jgi:hypothetical protein